MTAAPLTTRQSNIRVGILGAGTIANCVASRIPELEGAVLAGFATRSDNAAVRFAERFCVPRLSPSELASSADVVVEAAEPAALQQFAPLALAAGATLIVMSVNGLISQPQIHEFAARSPGRLVLTSGALAGIDAILAARVSGIDSIRLRSSKPPSAFPQVFTGHEPSGRVRIFSGTARRAAEAFPKNSNVGACLALAAFDPGTGPDRVQVEIWADPALTANHHEVEVESPAGTIRSLVINQPMSGNAATSIMAANSAIATLRKLVSSVTFL